MTTRTREDIERDIRYWEGVDFSSDYCDSFSQANEERRRAQQQIHLLQVELAELPES